MTFNIQPEELTSYHKLDVEFSASKELEIAYADETRFLSDTIDDTTYDIMTQQNLIYTQATGKKIEHSYDAVPNFITKHGIYANDKISKMSLELGMDAKEYLKIQAEHKWYATMRAFKNDPKYANDPFVKKFVTNQEEMDNVLADEAINNQYAAQILADNDYRSGFLNFTGRIGAQMFDDPATLLYMATIPLVATPIGMMSSSILRVAAWIGEGAIGATILEGYQQTGTRKLREKMDLRISNPKVQQELEEFGIDWRTLGVSDEELNSRLEFSFLGGALFGGGIAVLGEIGRTLMKSIMKGDTRTINAINDLANEIKNSGLNDKIIQNLTPDELVQHFRKIAVEANNVNFNKKYLPVLNTIKQPIKDFNKAINEIETKLLKKGEKLTAKQHRALTGLMRYHNYDIQFHNSIVSNQLLKHFAETGEWTLRIEPMSETILLKNADELLTNFKGIEAGVANEKWFMSALMGKKSGLRNFLNKDEYLKSLSKNADERAKQILDDMALVNLLNATIKQYSKFPTRGVGRFVGKGKSQSMQQIITDVLEVSYGRDIITNNVVSMQRATRQDFMNRLDVEILHTTDPKKINKFHGNNIIKEIYGEATGDVQAKILAKQITLMFDDIHMVATKYGMSWNKLNNFFPQTHVGYKVGQVPKNTWVEEIFPALDKARTGKLLDLDLEDANFDQLLKEELNKIYDNIVIGDTKSAFANVEEGFKLRLKNAHSRVLFFKDADSWLNYNKQYGKDVLVLLDEYMDHASMEIAMLRVFGPNPMRNAKRLAKFAKDYDGIAGVTTAESQQFGRMFDHLSGAEFAVKNKKFAKGSSAVRALLVTAQLGSAYIMTLADLSYGALTRMLVGMPAHKTVNGYVKFLYNSQNTKALAREARVVAHEIGDELKNSSRFSGEKFESGYMAWASNKLMKVSLLAPGTAAARTSFKYEFQFHLRDLVKKPWAELNNTTKYMYKRYGITEADHAAMGKQKLYQSRYDRKVQYIRIGDVEDEALRHKFYTFMFAEVETAVPTMMARSRAFMMRGTKPGTGEGEVARAFWLFKNFPMTIMYTQLARAGNVMLTHPSHAARVGYPAGLVVMTSSIGMLLYQIKNLLKGEDPAPLNVSTITKGLMYGGGMGFFADVALQDTSQYGRSFLGGVAGPVFNFGNDLFKLGLKPLHDSLYRNKNTLNKLGPDLVTFLAKYTPYNNLWYTRAATNALIFDNLKKLADPKYNAKKRKWLKRLKKEHRGKWIGDNLDIKRQPKWENIYSWKPIKD